jgi:GNAT superfamily N-acetyltransferase
MIDPVTAGVRVRPLAPGDSIAELTALLHRAYAPLAAAERFYASRQDEAATRRRCAEGECWVAELDGRIVGTIVLRAGGAPSRCELYARPDVAIFGQFAVQGRGVGAALLERVERRARERGFARIACDTAEGAARLVGFYARASSTAHNGT